MTTWTYEQAEPTSTYLITLQIGDYDRHRLAKTPVPIHAVLPDRLRRNFDHDFGRQPQMMKLFVKLFGPYPLATGYTVVVTDDDLEIPLEAQGISIFGANHCDGQRDAERLIAHELAHQWFGNSVTARRWRDIWLHEGFACYAEWLWSEDSGGPSADEWAHHYHQQLAISPQDLLLSDPGPRDMFDDRVYKRGALTLHVLRRHHRRRELLCAAAGLDDTAPPRHRGHRRLHRPGRQLRARVAAAAVGRVAVLDAVTCRTTVTDAGSSDRARSPAAASPASALRRVLTALCGYAVLYLAARDLEPAGFSVFGVFWGAFGLVTGAAYGLLQEATRRGAFGRATPRYVVGPAHPSDAGGGDGRRGCRGGDRGHRHRCGRATCSSSRDG